MKRHPLNIILVLGVMALSGCCSLPQPAQRKDVNPLSIRRYPNLIAHIEHNGLSFSVSLDASDPSFLKIHIPVKDSPLDLAKPLTLPTVELRVQMTNDAVIKGAAQKPLAWAENGGYAELEYRFALGRRITVDEIHSVAISIDAQRYELYPF